MSPKGPGERPTNRALAKELLQLLALLLALLFLEGLVRMALGLGPPMSTFEYGF